MSQAHKRGFKPGANMPHDDYDPMEQGMSDSGNHAVGHAGNDSPSTTEQHGRQPARSAWPAFDHPYPGTSTR